MPILSVIIPCFNNGNLLLKMIDCCLKQTFLDWELIIVDDQSTDDTPLIVKNLADKDNRIKFYIRNREPKGSVVCRNIGFDYSTGKYIMHFDADDLISNTCFEHRVLYMEANPSIDYSSFPAQCFYSEDDLPLFSKSSKMFGVPPNNGDLLGNFLSADYPFSVWNNIYRRTSITNIRWDEKVKIYTDFSYIIPCILYGLIHKFSMLKEIDYYYRVTYSSKNMCSSFTSIEKCNSTIYLFSSILNELSLRKDYKIRKKQFENFIMLHFSRLLKDNDNNKISEYLNFCSLYYSSIFIKKLKLLFYITKIIPTHHHILKLLESTLLGRKALFLLIKNYVINRK